ncbi:RNA 2',3'-cyclic phosphodiesterase [Patescibacteria group bacterium]|nr:RNA 2',3'-cyclic phosphodiesterase [Patescibacteria group bacterium]
MKHRVFIALPIPSSIKKEIAQWKREHSDMPVRFIKKGNLHITIVPPWYTDNLRALKQTLHAMEKPKNLTLTFSEIAFGPTQKNPRLIWVTGLKNLRLQKAKQTFEHSLGVTPEKRLLIPHITIARFNHLKNPSAFQKSKIHWKCTMKTFCLMESHLLRTGAQYRTIQTYHLY